MTVRIAANCWYLHQCFRYPQVYLDIPASLLDTSVSSNNNNKNSNSNSSGNKRHSYSRNSKGVLVHPPAAAPVPYMTSPFSLLFPNGASSLQMALRVCMCVVGGGCVSLLLFLSRHRYLRLLSLAYPSSASSSSASVSWWVLGRLVGEHVGVGVVLLVLLLLLLWKNTSPAELQLTLTLLRGRMHSQPQQQQHLSGDGHTGSGGGEGEGAGNCEGNEGNDGDKGGIVIPPRKGRVERLRRKTPLATASSSITADVSTASTTTPTSVDKPHAE